MSHEVPLEEIRNEGGLDTIHAQDPDDLFITCASFEPRSGSVVHSLSDKYRAKSGIVYVNRELLNEFSEEKTQNCLREIKNKLENHCDDVQIAKGSWLNPSEQLNALKDAFQSANVLKERPKLTIDVTTFNRESLLILLNLVYNRIQHPKTRIIYVSPIQHGEWLTRGHRTIRNIIGHTGLHQANKPTVLVLLSGFEQDRAQKTIEEFEPSKVLLGIGDPAVKERFLDRNIQAQELILSRQDTKRFEFPANDIKSSYEKIEGVVSNELPNNNVVVAPLNTKLSTIGAWRAVREHPEVQVTYSIPGEYNYDNYSEGTKELYVDYINPK